MSKCFSCRTPITESGQDASYEWKGERVCASCYIEYADNKIAELEAQLPEAKPARGKRFPTYDDDLAKQMECNGDCTTCILEPDYCGKVHLPEAKEQDND